MTLKVGIGTLTGQAWDGDHAAEYARLIDLVRLAESSGLDSAWFSEHHFAADGYLPSVLPLLAAVAARTEGIELATGLLLAPFHDPVRLAEDFAVVDQISAGRTICGIGQGYREEEFRGFGIERRTSGARLAETVEILRRAWAPGPASFDGEHFRLDRVAVTPKPARTPPILIGAMSDRAVRRAGRLADGLLAPRDLARLGHRLGILAEAWEEAGRAGTPQAAVGVDLILAADPDRAWDEVAPWFARHLGTYAGWWDGTDTAERPLRRCDPGRVEMEDRILIGNPAEVVEELVPTLAALAVCEDVHLSFNLYYPGTDPEVVAEAVELLGGVVAPALRGRFATQRTSTNGGTTMDDTNARGEG